MLTIPFVLLVLAILVSLASVICHLALPSILRILDSVAPELRAQLLLFAAGAPWLIGASVLMSSLGDIFFGACDFGSACLWNEDPAGIRPESILAALPLLCATIFLCARAVRQRLISRRVLSAFDAASDLVADSAVRVIQTAPRSRSPAVGAFTCPARSKTDYPPTSIAPSFSTNRRIYAAAMV